ncbi:MAG: Asp-tRNA(Asn)/Glu-tRNA(Gln) amidotransferase subunit GatA [Acetobacter sp.]|nr:Asp-tRNA(Asn)/Glu-tRNA(Gln) amidotransferase subunit GatA [Bacteroides sp.]MCM1342018.1 Asp-tRNA(Asn)/Glu-tRNA(Gln) amidotransferase subunit GatA [Acetobacter sp.]MCM1434185.1 Asp-tRNA(Asn)/Glu-tRNA(Gln) amidotransferase subunit GatA [Clostridiales bacterium]
MKELISPLSKLLQAKEISAAELTEKYITAIEAENKKYNAYVSTTFDKAIENAKTADEMIAAGRATALTGIPMTLKDNICSDGDLTTCCSKILEGFRPYYDSTVWSKLKAQGAVMLGKTNMDEFAMGSTSETSCYGAPLNPRNVNHVTGGSSGGVAAAVAGNIAAYGLGSDTGGSVRQPASFCGIVGLKPTYGAVSRYGLIAYGSSLDQIGVLANSVKDTALVFDAVSGVDANDQTSVDFNFGSIADTLENADVKGLKIGIAKEYFEGINSEMKDAILDAVKLFEANGAEIIDISLPVLKQALPVYYIIACAEASSNLGRYDGIRYGYRAESFNDVEEMILKTRTQGFGDEVKRRIMLGTYVLSSGYYDAYYKKACLLRENLIADFDEIFNNCDILIAPTAPNTAFPLNYSGASPVDMYLSDIATVPINITGVPAVSVPIKNDSNGLPIGMQIIGKKFSEKTIMNAAYFYEKTAEDMVGNVEGGVQL